ncbi:glucoside xylosyltransferase 1-like [Oratosquilla oratoria]|uniref:glucoside xylosyltransferase 1-like n=1 Tax=Oratosquilla oratoria TaxID=337810 RepID=UPI003F75FBBF
MKCAFRLLVLIVAAFSLLILIKLTEDVRWTFGFLAQNRESSDSWDISPLTKVNNIHTNLFNIPSNNASKSVVFDKHKVKDKKDFESRGLVNHDAGRPQDVTHGGAHMTLAAVCCGSRLNETMTMLKSATALSSVPLRLLIFTEPTLRPHFISMYESWPAIVRHRVALDVRDLSFPKGQDHMWRTLFKPCASQRLFLPSLLEEEDALMYVDTDVLFLAPPEVVWGHFARMNASQMAAMAPEHEDLATGWYNRFARHPYYGRLGVNSGVMLMNLTRLRAFGWEEYLLPIYQEYHLSITWGDQDIINIIFHYHPDKLYIYGCEYNLRPDHCMYMSVCKAAEQKGVVVLHGNRGSFHTDKQPAFKAIYRAWEEYNVGEDLRQRLYYPMQKYLLQTSTTNCGKIQTAFLLSLAKLIDLR